jgi:hypothetical protein
MARAYIKVQAFNKRQFEELASAASARDSKHNDTSDEDVNDTNGAGDDEVPCFKIRQKRTKTVSVT